MREKMPNRRHQVVVRVIVKDEKYQIGVGFTSRGLVREVWGTGPKIGSDMWSFVQDVCTAISIQLQEGKSPQSLANPAQRYPDGSASSIYGVITDILCDEQKVIHEAIGAGFEDPKEP